MYKFIISDILNETNYINFNLTIKLLNYKTNCYINTCYKLNNNNYISLNVCTIKQFIYIMKLMNPKKINEDLYLINNKNMFYYITQRLPK